MHWIDIVLIAIVALTAIIGFWKGFFDGIISICSIFVSLIIAVSTANWFAGVIRSIVDIDGWLNILLRDTFGVGDSLVIFGASYPREKLAAFLTVVFAGIVMFILVRCVVALLKNMFRAITEKSKALGGINRLLGLVLGAVKGVLGVSVVMIVCSIITSLGVPGLSDTITTNIEATGITKYVYNIVDGMVEDKMSGKTFEEIIEGVFDEATAKDQDANTKLEVLYSGDKQYYEFTVGQVVDYSKITIIYKSGDQTSVVPQADLSYSSMIDTSTVKGETTITISAYGKTTELIYKVVQNNA